MGRSFHVIDRFQNAYRKGKDEFDFIVSKAEETYDLDIEKLKKFEEEILLDNGKNHNRVEMFLVKHNYIAGFLTFIIVFVL